MDNMLRKL